MPPTPIRRRNSPFFCYFGGKWRLAPYYAPPVESIIIEPFAGAAGYASSYPHNQVLLVDKNEMIVGLWRYLISVSSEELLALPEVPQGETVDDLKVCQEARWLIGFWLNKGGVSPGKRPSKWMKSEMSSEGNFWGPKVRERLARNVGFIRHWKILHGDYASIENQQATWFIDPPYQQEGRHYKHSSKDIDYDHLAQWCRERKGQVIVCENEGATWLPFTPLEYPNKETAHPKRKSKGLEVLWQQSEGQTPLGKSEPSCSLLETLDD